MHTDPIADLLTRIRNGQRANLPTVDAPSSTLKIEVLKILLDEGFIKSYEMVKDAKFPSVRVTLKYEGPRGKQSAISHIQKVSKPGLRVYRKSADLKPVLRGLGILILSTSHGIMTDRSARKMNVGGEVLCEVW